MTTIYRVDKPGVEACLHHLQTGHFVSGGTAWGEGRAECIDCRIVWTKPLVSLDMDSEEQVMQGAAQ